jgi:hypothetical protein
MAFHIIAPFPFGRQLSRFFFKLSQDCLDMMCVHKQRWEHTRSEDTRTFSVSVLATPQLPLDQEIISQLLEVEQCNISITHKRSFNCNF